SSSYRRARHTYPPRLEDADEAMLGVDVQFRRPSSKKKRFIHRVIESDFWPPFPPLTSVQLTVAAVELVSTLDFISDHSRPLTQLQ
ncbi:hypothetical protein PanWU01x14_225000, partial [Parasponia andersonii]